jgi:two-component system, response regulator PdtaR
MPQAATELAGAKALVVEDDMLVAMDHAEQLNEGGAEVVGPFTKATQAFDALESTEIDAAVLDFVLEDRNSAMLQEALERKGVPFVVVTGYPAVLVRRDSRQMVLSKPVPPGKLCSTVRAAWLRR